MTPEQLIARYPRLFHMSEGGSWPSIQRHGLLSTTALLDLFEIDGQERSRIETEWRVRAISIQHHEYGTAVIRDQGPMPPHTLAPLLDGLTPSNWYELINRKSFFWATEDRLGRFLNAAPYRRQVHEVITVDTQGMVERHFERISLSSFNTGVSSFGPEHRRGVNSFRRVDEHPINQTIAEVAVDYSVPDLVELVISVEEWQGLNRLRRVWAR